MVRAIRRYSVLLGAVVTAMLAGPLAVAHADDNSLRITLNSHNTRIGTDENAIKRGLREYRQSGTWRPLVRAYNQEARDLRAERTQLLQDQPSTATGRKAKADLVKGFRLKASGLIALGRILQAANGGMLPRAQTLAAMREGNQGARLIKQGYKLLS